jgi:hypothetical protein
MSKEAIEMAVTLPEQVTVLRQAPTSTDPADADLHRDGTRGRRRQRTTAGEGDDRAHGADSQVRPLRLTRVERSSRRNGAPSYLASIVDIAPVLPTVGAIVSVFAYVGGPAVLIWRLHEIPLLIGATAAIVLGLLVSCLHRSIYTSAERAHPRSFAEIRQRVDSLAAQIGVLEGELPRDLPMSQRLAFQEAVAHSRALEQDLVRSGPQWILGTGYVDAMTRLHRAEEALVTVQPVADVLAGALFDELRIAGSTMVDRDHLLAKLRTAVQTLRPSATAYLRQASAGRGRPADAVPPAVSLDAHSLVDAHDTSSSDDAEARIVLRDIRRSLNDFRDERRAELIRSRGRLLGTMTMTGVITYVLLAFAMGMDKGAASAMHAPIAAAAAIYLVGAVVGLFNRLYVESGDDAAGEDYGLSKARLLLTPMLSGLAAVGGVMITGMLSGVVDIDAITPLRAVSGASAATLDLGAIFNLHGYPFALVLAAMFGLAPKTFLKRLQKASEQSALDLKSTAASPAAVASQR